MQLSSRFCSATEAGTSNINLLLASDTHTRKKSAKQCPCCHVISSHLTQQSTVAANLVISQASSAVVSLTTVNNFSWKSMPFAVVVIMTPLTSTFGHNGLIWCAIRSQLATCQRVQAEADDSKQQAWECSMNCTSMQCRRRRDSQRKHGCDSNLGPHRTTQANDNGGVQLRWGCRWQERSCLRDMECPACQSAWDPFTPVSESASFWDCSCHNLIETTGAADVLQVPHLQQDARCCHTCVHICIHVQRLTTCLFVDLLGLADAIASSSSLLCHGARAWQLFNEETVGVNQQQGFACAVSRFWFGLVWFGKSPAGAEQRVVVAGAIALPSTPSTAKHPQDVRAWQLFN